MTKRFTDEYKITDFFGCNVFNDKAMHQYLSEKAYLKLKDVINNNSVLDSELAGEVAKAMMEWATANGATHYTHWFQPLTGSTAEKHDAFITIDNEGNTVYEFSGKNLRRGEADASSFPSGGIRATFEARGYTVWDCSSPAFIKKDENGIGVLYIPTAFCSYTGETLDKKTPLLHSMEALNKSAKKMLEVLERPANNVNVCVGGEQEYFLIDIKDSDKRADIRLAGRTLFGAPAPKGQEKDDQYYASIRERVKLFMADVNEELWKLGITAKTQHNEVAPCQHELAPIFTTVNIATDQNQLIMETLKTMARKHNLTCLLHEKPFKGLNGSGKHDNWSLVTDDGRNLLKPGDNPLANWEFLVFFTAVISAVDEYSELVRYSASNVGNDSRLGGNEAPPTIISVNTGEAIENILKHLSDGMYDAKKQRFTTGIGVLANFSRDNTDRNRTSPFAFTGNKFEFRMVGSSATLANPNTVLNTIVSEMLDRMSFEIEERGKDEALETAVMRIVTKYYNEHKRIIFNGNNYSEEWYEEAKKRGLPLIKNCIDSYEVLKQDKTIELYEKHNVMNRRELLSRYEVSLDDYVKTILIEARTMISMARQDILPSVMRYEGQIAKDYNNIRLTAKGNVFKDKIMSLDEKITNLNNAIIDLDNKVGNRNESDKKAEAVYIRDVVVKSMDNLRAVADDLEINCDRALWPFPTYADILFYE